MLCIHYFSRFISQSSWHEGARPGVFEKAGCCKCGAEVRWGGIVVPDTSTKGVPFSRIVARDMSALEPMIPCTLCRLQLMGPSDNVGGQSSPWRPFNTAARVGNDSLPRIDSPAVI